MSQLNVTSLKHEGASGDNITLSSNGNVGIGTSSPANELHTFSGSSTATVAKFAATNYGNAGTTYIEIGTQYGDGGSRIGNINPSGNLGTLVFETMTETSGVFAERLRIDSAGRVTMPHQPMACSSWTGTQSVNNIVGASAPYVITNVGNHLSGGVFTCPVNGVYRATLTAMSGNANSINARLRFNGADYWGSDTFANYTPAITYARVVISALVSCSASDTLNFYLDNGSGNIHPGYGQISFELVG